jgi:hypothetical protein
MASTRDEGAEPVSGVCCACGYTGDEETPCPTRDDGHSHCDHWWDGPNEEHAPAPSPDPETPARKP